MRILRLVGLTVAFVGLCLGLTTVWASHHYGVSRETTMERARSLRLTIVPAAHVSAPYNAPVEQNFYVEMPDIPPLLRQSVIFREDQRFHIHPGFNPVTIAQAILSNILSGGRGRGGSTITQQVAKILYVGGERSLLRKFRELGVAIALDSLFTKDEILEIYLNVAPFGKQTRGIESAARRYFGYSFKKAGKQRIAFDALLAAQLAVTLSAPTKRNPSRDRNLELAVGLLKRMEADGIDLGPLPAALVPPFEVTDELRKEAARRGDEALPRASRYARDRAVQEAAELAPGYSSALEATLFYRSDHQLYLERAIERFYGITGRRDDYPHLVALVVDNRTGGVTAQYGETAGLEMYPASLVKPFIALCALHNGLPPGFLLIDEPFGNPPIQNANHSYAGAITLEQSIMQSTNTTAVYLYKRLTRDCVDLVFEGLGLKSWLRGESDRATALGAAPVPIVTLLESYLAIATCGRIGRIRYLDSLWAPDGSVFEPPQLGSDGVHPELARALGQLHHILGRTARFGTAKGVYSSFPIAAKTGTSDGNRQISLVSYTSDFTVLVSVRADAPARIRRELWGANLRGFVGNLNANIHIGAAPRAFGCAPRGDWMVAGVQPKPKPAPVERLSGEAMPGLTKVTCAAGADCFLPR